MRRVYLLPDDVLVSVAVDEMSEYIITREREDDDRVRPLLIMRQRKI